MSRRQAAGLTGNTSKQLFRKMLYLTTGERHKCVAFQEVEHTLSKEIRDNADVIPEVEAISKMYTFVAIEPVVV